MSVTVGDGKSMGYEVILRDGANVLDLRKRVLKGITEAMENAKEVESYHKINGR